jgi:hypothetical protein
MPDRDSIHKLVDSLPKEALETAERILQSSQTWRPEPPRDVPRMRASVKEHFASDPGEDIEHIEHVRTILARRGIKAPEGFPSLDDAFREASGDALEGETLVTYRIWRFQWHELEIEERFRISEDERKLQYSQQIQGPKGKKESFEIDFDCR